MGLSGQAWHGPIWGLCRQIGAGGQGAGELGEALPGGALSVARARHGTPLELPLEQDAAGGRAALTSSPRGRVCQEGACRGPAEEGSHRRRIPRGEALGHPKAADALAREHLDEAGIEGQIRRTVGEVLSAVREET